MTRSRSGFKANVDRTGWATRREVGSNPVSFPTTVSEQITRKAAAESR